MLERKWRPFEPDNDQIFYQDETGYFRPIHPLGGTSLMGKVSATLPEMVKILGKPEEGCDKSAHQWTLANVFASGFYASVYNYKQTRNYSDEKDIAGNYVYPAKQAWEKMHEEKRHRWHIGARTQDIADSAIAYLEMQLASIREDTGPHELTVLGQNKETTRD